jgi:hypothetical protein
MRFPSEEATALAPVLASKDNVKYLAIFHPERVVLGTLYRHHRGRSRMKDHSGIIGEGQDWQLRA